MSILDEHVLLIDPFVKVVIAGHQNKEIRLTVTEAWKIGTDDVVIEAAVSVLESEGYCFNDDNTGIERM